MEYVGIPTTEMIGTLPLGLVNKTYQKMDGNIPNLLITTEKELDGVLGVAQVLEGLGKQSFHKFMISTFLSKVDDVRAVGCGLFSVAYDCECLGPHTTPVRFDGHISFKIIRPLDNANVNNG